ncbi:MAG: glycoside hydrolase family 3 C-terminal domain-containing protein [Clostridiales bacterium]|nr:glycoside hydrolase family 3 C-terminal domain-containing protein [Clostridiales bacterium]
MFLRLYIPPIHLLSSFGDTLSSYLGGGTTVTSTDDSTAVLTDDEALAEGREMVTELEGEGAVLLRNENNTLPSEKGTKVTILGAMSYNYINGSTGSADGRNMDTTEDCYGHTGTGELATFSGSEYADNKDNYGDTGRQTERTMVITLQ